ncbi:MAG: hypothetical protein ACRD33_11540 [Candidatus Acidiferrales bacterium]
MAKPILLYRRIVARESNWWINADPTSNALLNGRGAVEIGNGTVT